MIVSHQHLWQGCCWAIYPTLHLPGCTQDHTHPRRWSLLSPRIWVCTLLVATSPLPPPEDLSEPTVCRRRGGYTNWCTPHLIFCDALCVLPLRYDWYYHLLALLFIDLLAASTPYAGSSGGTEARFPSPTMETISTVTPQATSYTIYFISYPSTTQYTIPSSHCYFVTSLPLPLPPTAPVAFAIPACRHSIINTTI